MFSFKQTAAYELWYGLVGSGMCIRDSVNVDFAAALGERRDAYERLLGDALQGSLRRFARQDVVEGTWRIVQPALDNGGTIHPYFRGSWGPTEADSILVNDDTWYPVSPT